VRRLPPELEEIFAQKIDLAAFYQQPEPSAPRASLPAKGRVLQPQESRTPARRRAPNVTEYLCSIKELGKVEKIILQLVVNAYLRGNIYQARIKILQSRASCGRATVFRALLRLVPEYMERISRPGKPNILKPSPFLLKHLGLSQKLRGLAREEVLSSLSKGSTKCRRISGMSRGFQHI
jgi:hypothetical protein